MPQVFIKGNEPLRVLEIGCNDGVFLNPLFKTLEKSDKVKSFELTGVDPSETINSISNPSIRKWNTFFNAENTQKI